jgi:hypothetical protein
VSLLSVVHHLRRLLAEQWFAVGTIKYRLQCKNKNDNQSNLNFPRGNLPDLTPVDLAMEKAVEMSQIGSSVKINVGH